MSNDTPLWDPTSPGVYVILAKEPRAAIPEVWNDPRTTADDAADDLADLATQYPNLFVSAILIGPGEDGGIFVVDVTADLVNIVRSRLDERGYDEEFSPPVLTQAAPIVAHIARWADGCYGSLAPSRGAEQAADLREAAAEWVSAWGHTAPNQGLVGLIVRLEKDADGWRAALVEHFPALDEGPSIRM